MDRMILAAPMTGWLMEAREVPDPVFSEGMLGTGFAIDPVEGQLLSPCGADVVLVAPTHHSVTLRTPEGAEILIHVGLETVALQGRGFTAHVRAGDRVASGDLLITFDLDAVGIEAKSLATPIILTNADEFELTLGSLGRMIAKGDSVGSISRKHAAAEVRTLTEEERTILCAIGFAHGLHARPAARVADAAKPFASVVKIAFAGKIVSARSPVAIMGLNVAKGDTIELSAAGVDRDAALAAIAAVLASGEQDDFAPAPAPVATDLAANELAGLCAMAGVAVGSAVHWKRTPVQFEARGKGVELERSGLAAAVDKVAAELGAAAANIDGPGGDIARAHAALLQDEDLQRAAIKRIEGGESAAQAWTGATQDAAELLRKTGNLRMQQRIADLDDVRERLVRALTGDGAPTAQALPEQAILLADDLLPSELLSLDRGRLAGIAVEGGGATSHMAIIAASMDVPTLVAVGGRLAQVPEGTRLLLEAGAGKLVIEPDDERVARALQRTREIASVGHECRTLDGQKITLLANLGGVADVEGALAAGAEGCGLLRTEFLFLDRPEAPSAEEQKAVYQEIADALGARPLTIRTLDIGGDKPVPFIDFGREENPALGARGVRTGLVRPGLLDEQLQAIAEVEGAAIKLMVPMVSSVAELRAVRNRLKELCPSANIRIGAMVETPSAALTADCLVQTADFLSIGTNDLSQYTLAMDRTNARLAPLIDALHPAVLRLIAMTAEAGSKAGTPVSVCGNLAGDPAGALVLLGFGITELSAAPATFASVRHAIAQVTIAQCRELSERAVQLESAAEVRALAAGLLGRRAEGAAS